MRHRRVLSALCCLTLLPAVVAGCGGSDDEDAAIDRDFSTSTQRSTTTATQEDGPSGLSGTTGQTGSTDPVPVQTPSTQASAPPTTTAATTTTRTTPTTTTPKVTQTTPKDTGGASAEPESTTPAQTTPTIRCKPGTGPGNPDKPQCEPIDGPDSADDEG